MERVMNENNNYRVAIYCRLSKDDEQTGYYTDVYYNWKHVRYIAVNDGVDTSRETTKHCQARMAE